MKFKFDINSINTVDGINKLSYNYEKVCQSFLDDLELLRSNYKEKDRILKDLNVLKNEKLILDFDSSKININTKFSLYKMVDESDEEISFKNELLPLIEPPAVNTKMRYICSLSIPNKALIDNGLKEIIIKYLEKELDRVNKNIDELKIKLINNQ